MSDEEKKALDEYIGNLIETHFNKRYASAEQSQKITKDLKNGKDKISVKDISILIGTILAMLTVIFYSVSANTNSETTKVSLASHECIDAERTTNIEKRLDRIETKLDRVIGKAGKE